jgi:hypothetical protein
VTAWFQRVILARRWLAFAALCMSFLVFGLCTLNLVFSMRANLELIAEHGVMALEDGALEQFIELVFSAALGMAAYVVFKACEHSLVHRLTDAHPDSPTPPTSSS